MTVTLDCLRKQNAETSNAIISHFASNPSFLRLSDAEGLQIRQRDKEDSEKLQKGIDLALEKGVLSKDFVPEPYIKVDVLGKSAEDVANEILDHVAKNSGSSKVIVLVGLSGTGKGTTVAMLRKKLEGGGPIVTWSNGNIFRSLTLLAATWCEHSCDSQNFDINKALTKDNLATFVKMLSFGKFKGDVYDTRINGLGLDLYVSEVANTELKIPKVAKNIPTVAEVTQGEVISFAAGAIKILGENGITVLLEGREETVNYVETKNRFCLTLSDESLIGKRRAAQRMMASALNSIEGKNNESNADVVKALETSLEIMVNEITS